MHLLLKQLKDSFVKPFRDLFSRLQLAQGHVQVGPGYLQKTLGEKVIIDFSSNE